MIMIRSTISMTRLYNLRLLFLISLSDAIQSVKLTLPLNKFDFFEIKIAYKEFTEYI